MSSPHVTHRSGDSTKRDEYAGQWLSRGSRRAGVGNGCRERSASDHTVGREWESESRRTNTFFSFITIHKYTVAKTLSTKRPVLASLSSRCHIFPKWISLSGFWTSWAHANAWRRWAWPAPGRPILRAHSSWIYMFYLGGVGYS